MKPKRIRRRRTKGWRMPEGAIYVGRPTVWGNPFTVGERDAMSRRRTIASAVDAFRARMEQRLESEPWADVEAILAPLRGHDLVCWCPLDDRNGNAVPCRADVLLELANA